MDLQNIICGAFSNASVAIGRELLIGAGDCILIHLTDPAQAQKAPMFSVSFILSPNEVFAEFYCLALVVVENFSGVVKCRDGK
jgi:hypothetical protein